MIFDYFYNLVWKSPSVDYNGSMPIGNGETGLNIWVERSGDIIFYISRTDSWDENNRLLKIGGCRIKYFPEINLEKGEYTQTLNLEKGCIEIVFQIMDYKYQVDVWVDAHHQCINFDFNCSIPTKATILLENWRVKKRQLDKDEYFFLNDERGEYYSWSDDIVENEEGICWYHHNRTSRWHNTLKLQYLEELIDRMPDPLLHRTFGGKIMGEEFIKINSSTLELKSKKKSFDLQVSTLTIPNCDNPEKWINKINELAEFHRNLNKENARKEHESWWQDFWQRSWIIIDGFDEAFELTQNYMLQRWVQACGGRGNYAIKFNGSIFTVNTDKYDPDYRRWGGWYWFQNTRFPYWPMLASGDWDLMEPFWNLYLGTRELAVFRNKKYYNHDGWFFPETMSFWGTYVNQIGRAHV